MWNLPASTILRTFLAEPWLRSWPRRGTRITLFPSKRMGAVCPGEDLDLNLKVGVFLRFDWNLGKPTLGPGRCPLRDLENAARARATSTEAHSKTSAATWSRQERPRLPSSFTIESSASPRFQALKWLMRDWADQESTGVSWSLLLPASSSAARFSRLAFTRAT